MNQLETANYLIKNFSKHTVSVTKRITFDNAKECALFCAHEVRAQYEYEDERSPYTFWTEVINYLNEMKLSN